MNRRTVLKLGASLGPWRENQSSVSFSRYPSTTWPTPASASTRTGSAHLRSIREYGCLACQKQRVFSQMPAETSSFAGEKQLISFVLKLLNRDFSPGVGLQMCVELIVLLHTGFAGRACRDTGTEFLKVYTYPVEGETASAVGTFNSRQCWA